MSGCALPDFKQLTESLIGGGSRSSVVMQLVQVSQVSDCSYLQESEIVFAGTTKMGDVAMEGGTPVIVLADTAVAQQVVPPSECARALLWPGDSHGHLPNAHRKTDEPFRSVNLSDVMLFRQLHCKAFAREQCGCCSLARPRRCSELTFTNVPLLPKLSCTEGRREGRSLSE